jgi:hypothetical protein
MLSWAKDLTVASEPRRVNTSNALFILLIFKNSR